MSRWASDRARPILKPSSATACIVINGLMHNFIDYNTRRSAPPCDRGRAHLAGRAIAFMTQSEDRQLGQRHPHHAALARTLASMRSRSRRPTKRMPADLHARGSTASAL
jgi:hypothetical protein